ncbi:hypothetical protein Glove_325g9 [Diversispora epigaea]|uniref:Protein kinase domain-containing protein n=1 Tax=Diversispora epigaea TaxID=1348612 RepID=A0A397HMW6_9GLOM|nr:hypothetical protein Glove_325g9 [Diversispora epigaea]
MSQGKLSEKEWETWMDNLIIEDTTIQKENITFYQYSEFENVKLISGNVYKANFKISQKPIALKYVSLNDKFTLDNLINEVKSHRKLEIHNNILELHAITKQENTNDYMIILEYVNEGSLRQFLKTNFQKLDWKVKLNLAKQIANVLMYLHSNEIIHGKLNSKTILIHNGNIKLNVFGKANCIFEYLRFPTIGPIQYKDPQYFGIFHMIGKNKSSDIFSLGIILWEISSGNPPFEIESSTNVDLLNYVNGKREMVIPGTPCKYKETYTDCWKHNGNSRPGISQVVKNLSEIIISDSSFKNATSQSQPYNFIDEVISEKSNMQSEEQPDSPFIDASTDFNGFIKDLLEFFINLCKKQFQEMRPIMIKDYIRKHKKNPVEILYEMISHPSHRLFTCLIGFFYQYGIGTVTDYQMAFKFFNLAVNEIIDTFSSSPSSLKLYNINKEMGTSFLANMYSDGLGVKKDTKKAFQIYYKLAAKGSLIALNSIAYCYDEGIGVEKNEEKAFKLYLKSAEEGFQGAQYNVGLCYMNGTGTEKDKAKGFQWVLKSACAGNIIAIREIGYCYNSGKGVGKDQKEAFKWILKAAEKGYSIAQYNLGYIYENGHGIDENQEKAFEWYKKSAENDHINGQYVIGIFFFDGHGTKKDIVKAIYWLNKAKENGNTDANELLEYIIGR